MEKTTELKASGLLLDLGVAVPIRPLGFFHKRRKPHRIVMRTPSTGDLLRIGRLYLQTGVRMEDIKGYDFEANMEFMVLHAKAVSRMVAYAMAGGKVKGWLLNRLLAWWLRWRVHPLFLQEAWFQMINMLDLSPFKIIISSAQQMNLMKPKLSRQNRKRS